MLEKIYVSKYYVWVRKLQQSTQGHHGAASEIEMLRMSNQN